MCSFGPKPSVGIVSVTETTAYIVELEGAIGSAWHVVM